MIAISVRGDLRRDRWQTETIDRQLFLEAWLVYRLRVTKSGRRGPTIPLFEAGGNNRDSRSAKLPCAKINNRARTVSCDDLASPNIAEFVSHTKPSPVKMFRSMNGAPGSTSRIELGVGHSARRIPSISSSILISAFAANCSADMSRLM